MLGEIRGLGLMVGVDVLHGTGSAGQRRDEIVDRAFEHGLLLLGCGTEALRFCPPLVLSLDEVDVAVGILDTVLGEITSSV